MFFKRAVEEPFLFDLMEMDFHACRFSPLLSYSMNIEFLHPFCLIRSVMRLALLGLGLAVSLPSAFGQDATVQLEHKVGQVLNGTANNPAEIEAALQKFMAETRPTAAGMKVIATAAMKKVASYNKHDLMAVVTEGMVRAGLSQALKSGVDPIKASAEISEGLVSSAMGTNSRRGGNSIVTSIVLAQASIEAIVQTSGQLGIPASNAANASAFGITRGALSTSIEYGYNHVATMINVASGLAEGAVYAARRIGVAPDAIAQAAMTGAVDSIHLVASAEDVQVEPILEGARQGFHQGMKLATGRGVKALPEKKQMAQGLQGKSAQLKTVPVRNPASGMIEVRLDSSRQLADGLNYYLLKNERVVAGPKPEAVFVIGSQPTAQNVGVYSIQVRQPGNTHVLTATPMTLAKQSKFR